MASYTGGGGVVLGLFAVGLSIAISLCCVRRARFLATSKALAIRYADDDVEDHFAEDFQGSADSEDNLVKPASIEFENIGLTLNKGGDVILDGVTGRIPPFSLVALMGPSGCGKTTFMNALQKNTPYGTCTGTVKVNNDPSVDLLKDNLIGFVPQDDIVHGSLTVYQNLYYSAMTRLPNTMSKEQKRKHVQDVIKVLGLNKVQNALVGTPEKRGVSGGQKKRVNIGMELAAMPSFLFMDEPTSGLDGAATVSLAKCMSVLRKSGLTIICVIHQPRWLVFEQFTHVLLLGEGGKTVYWGRSEQLVPYLSSLGFSQPKHENPADWMIDVCAGLEKRFDSSGAVDTSFACPADLFKLWDAKQKPGVLKDCFEWTQGDPKIDEISKLPALHRRQGAGLLTSLYYLTDRSFYMIDAVSFGTELVLVVLVGFLALLQVLLVPPDARAVTFYLLQNGMYFIIPASLYYLIIVVKSRSDYGGKMLVTMRELNSGVSLIATWFGIFIRTIVVGFLKALIYSGLLYTFQSPLQGYGNYFLSFLLGTWCWSFFAHWVSIFGSDQMTVILLLVVFVFMEPAMAGDYCITEGPAEGVLCPGMILSPPWFGGAAAVSFYQFMMLFSAELQQYPANANNDAGINATNYWRNLAAFDGFQGPPFAGGTRPEMLEDAIAAYAKLENPDYSGRVSSGIWGMIVLLILHNIATLVLLRGSLAWVRAAEAKQAEARARWWHDKFNPALRVCSDLCGHGHAFERHFHVAPPHDVQVKVERCRTMQKIDAVPTTSEATSTTANEVSDV